MTDFTEGFNMEMKPTYRTQVRRKIIADYKAYGSGIIIAFLFWCVMSLLGQGICPLSRIFGLPCPGCGMSRSFLLLLQGKWAQSLQMNPFAIIWISFLLVAAILRYFLPPGFYRTIHPGHLKQLARLACLLLLGSMLFYYIFKMTTVFPSAEPYIYVPDNLLERLLPPYQQLMQKFH